MNNLVTIFMDGIYDFRCEYLEGEVDKSPVRVLERGKCVQILESMYDQYINDLEELGNIMSYFCPEKYKHPMWNGEIIYL